MTDKRIVWILGAGFSRPLGGPLLRDLLTEESQKRLAATYDKELFPKLFGDFPVVVRELYDYGLSGKLWADAEEFLDYLDTAATPPEQNVSWKRLASILKHEHEVNLPGEVGNHSANDLIKYLAASARRLLAAECSAFVECPDVRREQWEPYYDWRKNLGPFDTIVSFNYDLVVETLFRELPPGSHSSPHIRVVVPGIKPEAGIRLLKLHGSVDWRGNLGEDGAITSVQQGERNEALRWDDDRALVIASPGPTKRNTTSTVLAPLWKMANEAIAQADAIVFIGYRFPETDANARKQILSAIRTNAQNYLPVHTVLGPPGLNASDQERLNYLLRNALVNGHRAEWKPAETSGARFNLIPHPLFTQDFLTVCVRTRLIDPPRQARITNIP